MSDSPRWARRVFRILLRGYPRGFRRRHVEDLWLTFERQLQEARGRGFRIHLALWTREFLGVWQQRRTRVSLRRRPRAHTYVTRSGGMLMHTVVGDLRIAFRSLRRAPMFFGVVTVTLALGIGASTAVFSVVNAVLLRPLPYPDSDALVSVWSRFDPESGYDLPQFPLSSPEYLDYRAQNETMRAVGVGASSYPVTLTGDDFAPIRVFATNVSASLFDVLQIAPHAGRLIDDRDDRPGAAPVVLMSHGLWQRRFGGDRRVVGRGIEINDGTANVIGVLPPGFAYPHAEIDLWFPLGLDPANPGSRGSHFLTAVARLTPHATLQDARVEMDVLMAQWAEAHPDVHRGHFLFLRPMLDDVVGDVRTPLWLLMVAVGAVVSIVSVNVANVVLARGEERRRETAVRIALGSSRQRIVQQLLVEGLVVAGLGVGVGVGLAHAGVDFLLALDSTVVPRADAVGVDGAALLFAVGIGLASALVFSLVPAGQAWRADVQSVLKESTRTAGGDGRRRRLRGALVVTEVALTFVLALSAGLAARSFTNLLRVDPGFRYDDTLMARLALPGSRYDTDRAAVLFDQLVERIRALPGVTAATTTSAPPLVVQPPNNNFDIEGRPEANGTGEATPAGGMVVVRPGFFEQMGVPLRQGRFFNAGDRASGPPAIILDETLARRFWPNEDPVGRRVRTTFADDDPWRTVVGVVGTVQQQGLAEEPRPLWYLPYGQADGAGPWTRFASVLIRTNADPLALADPVRHIVRELDPRLAVSDFRTLDNVVRASLARPRFTVSILATFALVALSIGAVGIYGVLAFTVMQRRQEIGIRIALGAPRHAVQSMILRQGIALATLGLAIGAALALAGNRVLVGLLFEVTPTDLVTYFSVTGLMLAVVAAASWFPARFAARLNPTEAIGR